MKWGNSRFNGKPYVVGTAAINGSSETKACGNSAEGWPQKKRYLDEKKSMHGFNQTEFGLVGTLSQNGWTQKSPFFNSSPFLLRLWERWQVSAPGFWSQKIHAETTGISKSDDFTGLVETLHDSGPCILP